MTNNEIREEVTRLSYECLDVALELKLIKRPKTFAKRLVVHVKNIECCWGGCSTVGRHPHISFGLKHPDISGTEHFKEYKHIANSKVIGDFKTDNPVLPRMAVIAHELAHAIDHWNKDTGWGAHKDTWRFLYGQLRRNWVNPLLQ